MRVIVAAFPLVTLLGLAVITQSSRDILWLAVRTCVTTQALVGRPLPCLALDVGAPDRIGTAILRAPGSQAHLVVMPLASIVGIEDPGLSSHVGRGLWRAALAARSVTADVFGGTLALEDVGLAVNSVGGRSQDQLHIHVSCLEPGVREALRRHPPAADARAWRPLTVLLEDTPFYGLRVPKTEADRFNPFTDLKHLPGVGGDPRDVSVAVVSTDSGDPEPGFIVLAYRASDGHAEKLLDHGCALAASPPG